MIYVYHHTDMDGIISAYLIAYRMRHELGRYTYFKFVPISNYPDDVNTYFNMELKGDQSVVVDYMYHPKATIWFDHHDTGLPIDVTSATAYYKFDPKAPSCARVIYDDSPNVFPSYIEELVKEVDIVDSASYRSISHIYATGEIGPMFRIALLSTKTEGMYAELIHLFLEDESVVKRMVYDKTLPEILQYRYRKGIRKIEVGKRYLSSLVQYTNDIIMYENVEDNVFIERFLPYTLYPEAKGVVCILKIDNTYTVSVHVNLFFPPTFNAGDICKKYGGGGHYGAGGVTKATYEEAKSVMTDILHDIVHETITLKI